jgi:predicted ATPase/class 3 adenylate cyclase
MAACPSCSKENQEGAKFCGECGSPLARSCAACGSPNEAERKFCWECGAPLVSAAAAAPHAPTPVAVAPLASDGAARELRLVSVLFADLVGFTSLSEQRDAEEVRELLSQYFDACRRVIERYGGTVQKFIGDAVMAVWGAPVAREDDAERAVRAALDIVRAVAELGGEVGAPGLAARGGVLTGEAAVMPGDASEGLVVGDLVNTASRIQGEAQPGTVLVGDATRRASEQAVAFEDEGERELKGKAEPVRVHRALRVTAARRGAMRAEGLEAPFVGRERELRLVKELFHASAEQARPQLVQITGIAGIGKSRLAWEFFKYVDGLAETVWWHRGRCLAYGEGVAYWALAEMVRTRAQILEGEEPVAARRKLDACLSEHILDDEEREWIGPRLANLLALDDRADTDRQDLFAAWRLFFERLADEAPLVMVFEDLQWADQALLAFVEYLLEWSSGQRLYVLALARPELAEQQPEFARSVRNSTSLALEPLSDAELTQLLDGYVPGLPGDLKAQVLARAQGVPLYAVETVRMLLDRGLLVQDGSVYRPTGEIEALAVPETLHALAAARLDGLPPEERQLVQQACVLGKTFTKQAIAAITDRAEAELEPLLAALVRKEVLSLQADPRWPERGQYGFLQELLREVAYETLSRRDRKQRHLAAVAALEQTFEGADQDVPEVIASHLLAAVNAAPDDPDAPEIRRRACDALSHAGERAAALAAPDEAQRYLDQAAELAGDDTALRARLLARAGAVAVRAGDIPGARGRLEEAIALHERAGDARAAAHAGIALADVDLGEGKLEEGAHRFEAAIATLKADGASPELAATYAALGRLQMLAGDNTSAAGNLEQALRLAETLVLEDTFVDALTSKAVVLHSTGRLLEARLLLEDAVDLGRGRDDQSWWRPAGNLAMVLLDSDRHAEAVAISNELVDHARKRGDREQLTFQLHSALPMLVALGRWDDALTSIAEGMEQQSSIWAKSGSVEGVAVLCEQGRLAEAEELFAAAASLRDDAQIELRAGWLLAEARLLRARARIDDALAAAQRVVGFAPQLGLTSTYVKRGYVEALEAALALGDLARADQLLAEIDALFPGQRTPLLDGQQARFRARVEAARGGEAGVDTSFAAAERLFDEYELVFAAAVTRLEHAEWLAGRGRAAEAGPLLTAARESFERLEAAPWLERVRALDTVEQAPVTA